MYNIEYKPKKPKILNIVTKKVSTENILLICDYIMHDI